MSTFSPDSIKSYRNDLTIETTFQGHSLKFITTWGLFSPKAIDEGSELLLSHIDVYEDDDCLDMGSGYGILGLALAKVATKGKTLLVDKDFVAVDYTKKNYELNKMDNCESRLSNGFSAIDKDEKFSLIVSNLPAKVGNEMLSLYLQDAYNHLKPGGRFVVVNIGGIRHFIKRGFNEIFGNHKKLKQGKIYTISQAVKD
ncbi:MAG: 16S rRNA (guanine1207-N2)-methyltransferase [Enterobacterales bacterium]|jgi:16S rRNA (guanine1207-N2)-methyltransferase